MNDENFALDTKSLSENDEHFKLDVKQLREQLKLTQDEFAEAIGLTTRTLRQIENGRKYSETTKFKILRFVQTGNKDDMMDCMIDYLRIQFATHDYEQVISDVLMLNVEYMSQQETRFYGYAGLYALDMIKVLYSEQGDSRGTLIELSGQGCRQFEAMLEAQGRTWFDFLDCCELRGGRATRLDLALNDYVRLLDLPKLVKKINRGECKSRFQSFDVLGGGKLADGQVEGITIYIGSRKSDFYLCFYEKDYEQSKKYNIARESVEIKNRYELRLKDDRARQAMFLLRRTKQVKSVTLGILDGHLCFVDRDKEKDKRKWETNKYWSFFIGKVEKIKLVSKPNEQFYVRSREWLGKYCMGTVKLVKEVDKRLGRSDFAHMLVEAKLSPRHENMIKVLTASKNDMITNAKS